MKVNRLKRLLILVKVLLATTSAQAALTLKTLPLSHGFRLVYQSAEFNGDWYKDKTVDPVVPARLFLLSDQGQAEQVQQYLENAFQQKQISVSRLEHDSVLSEPELQGAVAYEISALFPKTVTRHLGSNFGALSDSQREPVNCYGTALAFCRRDEARFSTSEAFHNSMFKLEKVAAHEAPRFGDILDFTVEGHAAVYLFDGLIFHKPTIGINNRFEIVRYEDVFRTFNATLKIARFYRLPSHNSEWDGFLYSMSGMSELDPPEALATSRTIIRYRDSCAAALR